jgi:hypothetical protein
MGEVLGDLLPLAVTVAVTAVPVKGFGGAL